MAKGEASKIIGAGAAATALGGAYKLGEFLYKAKRLHDVGPANAVYVRLINRVRADLDEVRRLLSVREVHDALEANPEKAKWVYGAMRDVRGALENITPHTERVGGDIEGGRRVGLRHRLYWVLNEKEKLENREKELNVAHGSLTEVIGFLTAIEPVEPGPKHEKHRSKESHHDHETRNTKIDVDIRHGGPDRVEERDVWVERDDRAPRRVEEHETWVEHRGPPRHEEHQPWVEHRGPQRHEEHETWVEHDRRPHRVEERDIWVDERGPRRYEERETWVERGGDPRYESHHDDRRYDSRYGRVDERELHIERDPRDPRHVEAQYIERGPNRYEEKRYEERRSNEPLGRRPESFEDRVPERETWMQSDVRKSRYGPYSEYAEYGAPQPSGAAEYRRRFIGDSGFGDQEVLNPQPVPMDRNREREVWVEEKEDFRYDEYGNRLPDRYLPPRFRSRM